MKKTFTLFLLISNLLIFAQIGMGTPVPRGALDINRPTTNTYGLVLPTNSDTANMLNPQGGTIAEGTIMYDSQQKCVRYFNGSSWSHCMVDAPPTSSLSLECSGSKFVGTYQSGTPLSSASFTITITNNSSSNVGPLDFQTGNLNLSGVSGITVSSVSPASTTFSPGQSRVITYNLAGTPLSDGILTATFSKANLTCTNSINLHKTVRFAYHGSYTIGSTYHSVFNSQLQNPKNYGSKGRYQGYFDGFSFTEITSTLSALSAADLLNKYDIICVRENLMSTADAKKLKDFVDAGGVLISLSDSHPVGQNIFTAFGGTGTLQVGSTTCTTNTNAINNGRFGDATNVTITGAGNNGSITNSQLPPNSTVLATNNIGPTFFITGRDGKAVFVYDDDVYTQPPISGIAIDTPQERFLHNIMAYTLEKAGL